MSVYSLFNAHALISFVQFYLNMNKLQLNPKAECSMHALQSAPSYVYAVILLFVFFVRLFKYELLI